MFVWHDLTVITLGTLVPLLERAKRSANGFPLSKADASCDLTGTQRALRKLNTTVTDLE